MKLHRKNLVLLFGVLTLTGVLLPGCSEPGGGIAVVPEVTALPEDYGLGAGEAAVSSTGNGGTDAAASGEIGSLVGRVVLNGTAPARKVVIAKGAQGVKDAEVCAAEELLDRRLILGEGQGVENVFIFMSKVPREWTIPAPETEAAIFDQKYCRFEPHCLIVRTGRDLKVLSADNVPHNTRNDPKKNQKVSTTIPPNDRDGAALTINYRRQESVPVPVFCDFHPWMSAYHLPLDHPYAALTDANGNFTIPNLPVGTYEFDVWHEAAEGGYVARKLKLTVGGDPQMIEYDSSQLISL